jgi:hypothetical protein
VPLGARRRSERIHPSSGQLTPILEVDLGRIAAKREHMDQAPCSLDQMRGGAVLDAIQEVCAHGGWRPMWV